MSHSRDPTRLLGRLELRTKYLLFGALFYPVIAVSSNLQNGFRVRFWKLNQVHATYLVPFGLCRWAKTTEEKGEIERGGDVKSFWAVSARTARVPGATTATTTKGGRERAALCLPIVHRSFVDRVICSCCSRRRLRHGRFRHLVTLVVNFLIVLPLRSAPEAALESSHPIYLSKELL